MTNRPNPIDRLILILAGLCIVTILATADTMAEADSTYRQSQEVYTAAEMVRIEYQPMIEGEDPLEDELITVALIDTSYFDAGIPLAYDEQDALRSACEEFGVDYDLALAVIEQESNFRNISGDGGDSIGYMQIQPKWWTSLMDEIGVTDLTDPAQNFRTGCAILSQLIARYGNTTDALTAYNSGKSGESRYAASVLSKLEGR